MFVAERWMESLLLGTDEPGPAELDGRPAVGRWRMLFDNATGNYVIGGSIQPVGTDQIVGVRIRDVLFCDPYLRWCLSAHGFFKLGLRRDEVVSHD